MTTYSEKKYFDCDIEKIIPYEFNNKDHPDLQINQIINSFQQCWFLNPIIIDENYIILAWHGRLLASKKLVFKTVPVIQYFGLTEIQKKKFRILDNRIWDFWKYNIENLEIELKDIWDEFLNELFKDFDLNLWEIIDYDESTEDEIPQIDDSEIIVKFWDIFKLWQHTLICGDSRNKETIELLMNWEKADLVWTDPPYNVNYESDKWIKIKNDNMSQDEFELFLKDIFGNYYEIMKEWSPIYVAHSDIGWNLFRKTFLDSWLFLSQCLIWNKDHFVLWRQDYHRKHEPILYWWKLGKKHFWNWWRDKSTVIQTKVDFIQKLENWYIINIWDEKFQITWQIENIESINSTIINFSKPVKSDLHPTMKPIGLIEQMIHNSSKIWALVVDLFNWSWSTLITCEKTWRICKSIDLDPKFVQVTIKRFYDYCKWQREIKCLNRNLDLNKFLHG